MNSNLSLTQFYPGVSYSAANPSRLLGGTQDNGAETSNGASWQMTATGDGGFSAIDSTDLTNTWYSSCVDLAISKTTDGSTLWSAGGGPIWSDATNGMALAPAGSGDGIAGDAPIQGAIFIAPYTMDPLNSQNLLAGAAPLPDDERRHELGGYQQHDLPDELHDGSGNLRDDDLSRPLRRRHLLCRNYGRPRLYDDQRLQHDPHLDGG